MADDGAYLDPVVKCLWYIPSGMKFKWSSRRIEGIKDVSIGVKGIPGGESVTHPGGPIFFLQEDVDRSKDDLQTHFPMVFACPSLVTISDEDIANMKVDNDDAPAQSADWPKVAEEMKCPCCKQEAKVDGKTWHVLASFQAAMMGREQSALALKMVWRVFCIACFDSLGCQGLYAVPPGHSAADMPTSAMPLLTRETVAPFSTMGYEISGVRHVPPFDRAIPVYDRVQTFVKSGFMMCISRNFNR
jgi:hypothetical protein